jgi:RHS repeat-associated protein
MDVSAPYYHARYYDQVSGRFISEDPIGFDGGDVNV